MTSKKSPASPEGQRLAVIVGVNNSAKSSNLAPLKYAENDAYEIARALQQEECSFSLVEPAILGREATAASVKSVVLELARKKTDVDFLLFYFSGHAQPLKMADEREDIFFVTHDFNPALAVEDATMYLSMRWLKEHFYQSRGAGRIVIILDCCYAGNIASTESVYDLDLRKLINGFFEDPIIEEHQNALRLILSATGHNITAHERDGHGCMTNILVQALTGQIAMVKDVEGTIDIYTLYPYLQRHISEQAPVLSGKITRPCILAKYPTERIEATPSMIPATLPILHPRGLPFDYTVCMDASFADLDAEVVNAFFLLGRVQDEEDFHPHHSSQVQLEHLTFFRNGSPTYATLLCFGINPSQWVPEAITRCTEWIGNDRLTGWRKDRRYRGSLIKQYNSALAFLADMLCIDRLITAAGSKQKQWELPELALREVLTNALTHREYVDCASCIHIEIFDDRVEIKSPADLPVPLKIASLGIEGNTHRRNSQITRIFNLYGYVEEAGSGIPRMRKELKKAKLPPPILDISDINASKMFRVIFKRPQKITPQLAAQRRLTRVSASVAIISALLAVILIFVLINQPRSCLATQLQPSGQLVCTSGSIVFSGEALTPFVSTLAGKYMSQCPGAHISVQQPPRDGAGLDAVEDGSINLAASGTLAPPDKTDLVDHPVAVIVYAVIVNSDVRITNLTTNQIKSIYAGKYTNWQELGGPNRAIQPLSRGSGSGTRFAFDTYILGSNELVPQPSPIADTQSMIMEVQKTPGAIGYADLYDVQTNLQSMTLMNIDGDAPTASLVQNNSYKFWSIEHMYTKGPATGLEQAFINYAESSNARTLAQNYSLVNISDMKIASLNAVCSR